MISVECQQRKTNEWHLKNQNNCVTENASTGTPTKIRKGKGENKQTYATKTKKIDIKPNYSIGNKHLETKKCCPYGMICENPLVVLMAQWQSIWPKTKGQCYKSQNDTPV